MRKEYDFTNAKRAKDVPVLAKLLALDDSASFNLDSQMT